MLLLWSMGGAATTKTLMQNYSALESVMWAGAACLCSVLRTVTPAARHGTSHPIPQQQSEQHSNPQRNARCSGLTVRAKQQIFRVEGSYTANLWAGMPAGTGWAIRWMLGIVGS